jgi:hypothetical protein
MRRIYWAALAFVVIVPLIFFLSQHTYLFIRFDTYSHGHIVVNEKVFDDYYKAYGGEALVAYAEKEGAALTPANFHATGHGVGEILFEHEGLGAVVTCGDSFEWGCLHQVMGRAFAQSGTGAIVALIKQCESYNDVKKRGQCEHGLGHGIMYAGNYDDTKFNEMMAQCDAITTAHPVPWNDSCHAGLMMEYNEHFMTMEYEGQNGRPVTTADPFSICDTLSSEAHKAICIFWVVPWVHGRLFDFRYTTDTFANLGALCARVPDTVLKKDCLQSIGRSIGINTYTTPQQALSFCVAASADTGFERICIERVAQTYLDLGQAARAKEMCGQVSNKPDLACRRSDQVQ